jgi:hypothetical protein
MRRIVAILTVMVLVVAGCATTDDAATAEESTTATQTAAAPTTNTEPTPQASEAVDAKVVFDGDACSYLGPTVIPAGTETTLEFDDSARPAALVVLLVEAGTSWDEVVASTGPGTASPAAIPAWVIDYWVQVESGSLVRTFTQAEATSGILQDFGVAEVRIFPSATPKSWELLLGAVFDAPLFTHAARDDAALLAGSFTAA